MFPAVDHSDNMWNDRLDAGLPAKSTASKDGKTYPKMGGKKT